MFSQLMAASGEFNRVVALINRFWPYARATRSRILLVLLLTLSAPILATTMLWLIRQLIDSAFAPTANNLYAWLVAGVVVIALGKYLVEYIDQCLDADITEQIAQHVRTATYDQIIRADSDPVQASGVGTLLAHLDEDATRVAGLIYGSPVNVFAHTAKAVCFVIFLFILNWQLTLVALLAAPFLAFAVMRISPNVRRASRIARQRTTSWIARAEERLNATALIHASDAYAFESARFTHVVQVARRAEVRALILEAKLGLATSLLTGAGSAVVLAMAVYQVQAQAITVGTAVAFLAALASLYDPFRGITQNAGRWQRAAASGQRLAELLDTAKHEDKTLHMPLIDAAVISHTQPIAIEFEHVSLQYPNGVAALHDVSLSISAGEQVAIVGASGSGKSSMLRALTRLHDPQQGIIRVGGTDIRQLPKPVLRATMAVAFQESFLFNSSIAANIRYERADASTSAVVAAARAAKVDEFVDDLIDGYASPVGPRGGRLSGGQRQRVALARALLRDTPILLLDEATSALDSETEELIHHALQPIRGSKTMIAVSHRLSTVRTADRICVLDRGRIVEIGTPHQLLQPGTRCHALFAAQLAAEHSPADQPASPPKLNGRRVWLNV
jgi:ATP-binding cassette, subfamily B, bacterial